MARVNLICSLKLHLDFSFTATRYLSPYTPHLGPLDPVTCKRSRASDPLHSQRDLTIRKVRVAIEIMKNQMLFHDLEPYVMKENHLFRNRKRFYFSNGDNKADRDVFKTIWVHWTHKWR